MTVPVQPQPLEDILRRIQGEYIEMPGHRLTVAQAQRLWGLNRATCDAVLGALVDVQFLIRNRHEHTYGGPSTLAPPRTDRTLINEEGKRCKDDLLYCLRWWPSQ